MEARICPLICLGISRVPYHAYILYQPTNKCSNGRKMKLSLLLYFICSSYLAERLIRSSRACRKSPFFHPSRRILQLMTVLQPMDSNLSQINIDAGAISSRAWIRQPEEDWTGVADPSARRRMQNKLNQRAQSRQTGQIRSISISFADH